MNSFFAKITLTILTINLCVVCCLKCGTPHQLTNKIHPIITQISKHLANSTQKSFIHTLKMKKPKTKPPPLEEQTIEDSPERLIQESSLETPTIAFLSKHLANSTQKSFIHTLKMKKPKTKPPPLEEQTIEDSPERLIQESSLESPTIAFLSKHLANSTQKSFIHILKMKKPKTKLLLLEKQQLPEQKLSELSVKETKSRQESQTYQSPFNHIPDTGKEEVACSEFFKLNDINKCCNGRNDSCYMVYHDTKCYCDMFCIEKQKTHNDCCPDAPQVCLNDLKDHSTNEYLEGDDLFLTDKEKRRDNEMSTTTHPYPSHSYSTEKMKMNDMNDTPFIQYKHGDESNKLNVGRCDEFLKLNSLASCCSNRNDECYMYHYDTKCYCDEFCNRRPNSSDCCEDGFQTCTFKSNQIRAEKECLPNETKMDNCNNCKCENGHFKCSQKECAIDVNLFNEINTDTKLLWFPSNYSEFWSKSLDYVYKHRLGTRLNRVNIQPLYHDYHKNEAFDFRSNAWRNFTVLDQGQCGASFAFSTLDVALDRAALHIKKIKKLNVTASVQHLLACHDKPNELKNCHSNTVETAWHFLLAKLYENKTVKAGGVLDDSCYPYTSQNDLIEKCKITNLNRLKCNKKSLLRISSSHRMYSRNISSIMKEIRENGPVQMIFRVYSDFFLYSTGIYSRHPHAKTLDDQVSYHSVNVFGWNFTKNGMPYWIGSNSWGTWWGESGTFKISMHDTDTEIGQHVYTAYSTYS